MLCGLYDGVHGLGFGEPYEVSRSEHRHVPRRPGADPHSIVDEDLVIDQHAVHLREREGRHRTGNETGRTRTSSAPAILALRDPAARATLRESAFRSPGTSTTNGFPSQSKTSDFTICSSLQPTARAASSAVGVPASNSSIRASTPRSRRNAATRSTASGQGVGTPGEAIGATERRAVPLFRTMNPKEEARIARTESAFRHVNERIAEASDELGSEQTVFVCECADPDCHDRLHLPRERYEKVRNEHPLHRRRRTHRPQVRADRRGARRLCGRREVQAEVGGTRSADRPASPRDLEERSALVVHVVRKPLEEVAFLQPCLRDPEGCEHRREDEPVDREDEREPGEEEDAADVDRMTEKRYGPRSTSSASRGGRGNGESELPIVTPAQTPSTRPMAATIQPSRSPQARRKEARIRTKRRSWASTQPSPLYPREMKRTSSNPPP